MPGTRISFSNAQGEQLAGILDLPSGPVAGHALLAHCFTCSKDLKAVHHLAGALNDAGIGVLRFDFTGLGQSEGDFAASDFSRNVDDLQRAAAWMSEHAMAPSLLVGHSLGGAAVLAAAPAVSSARAVVTIGAPSTPAHVRQLFVDSVADIEAHGEAAIDLGGRTFHIRRSFLDDLESHDLPAGIATLGKALLVMHAPLDATVSVDNAAEIFLAARHPKSFVSLDDADHLLTRAQDARYAGRVMAAWASRYLDAPARATAPLEASPAATVARTPAAGLRTDVVADGHRLVADEPKAYGGTALGPTPYDLLCAALASCTTMTLQMYARHKGIDLRAAQVRVTHDKVHAADCADCATKTGKIDEFRRELTLDGELSDAQRTRLLEIADRCPVHRTLESEILIRTTLMAGPGAAGD